MNTIANLTTLNDLLDAKQEAMSKIIAADKMLENAEAALSSVGPYLFPFESKPRLSIEQAERAMNKSLWRRSFDMTGFRAIMDTKAVQEFENSLERQPPDFTEANIQSIFLSLQQESHVMFRRGIVNTFRILSDNYKTNSSEPFRIGRKLICDGMASNWHGTHLVVNYNCNARNRLDDIDRVFKTLDGMKFTPRSLEAEINAAWKEGRSLENSYFQIKGFKKGTMHILVKREDLLERVNDLIAEHYGANVLAQEAAK